ncbi:hypothetical protein ACFYWS_34825 [Streptomyces sp. NPDC002795]|uniref:hypothetical protein n=1 Tax=Streptomyces sp. NPDC002795 TaxID=3364665 RepID=UPI0036883427
MLRTWLLGHRKLAVGAASVAAVCASAGAVVALDGGDGPDAYVAVGAAGAAPTQPGDRVAPSGKVELVPLDPPQADGPGASGSPDSPGKGAAGTAGGGKATGGGSDAGGAPPAREVPGESPGASGTPPAADKPSGGSGSAGTAPDRGDDTPSPSGPPGPAALKVGDPVFKDADKRWCQDVTLALHNSGGSAVRSGKVTFETHVMGALGIDWATIDVTKKLPVPIGSGEKKRKTWTVCVDEWRVPLGMRLETKDVDVDWK